MNIMSTMLTGIFFEAANLWPYVLFSIAFCYFFLCHLCCAVSCSETIKDLYSQLSNNCFLVFTNNQFYLIKGVKVLKNNLLSIG